MSLAGSLRNRFARPSLVDAFFGILLLVWFCRPINWQGLLADGDTGIHIRTGQWILGEHAVPLTDPFSFSRPGAPWFAWEWLADVIFALVHKWYGMPGVAGLAAVILAFASALLMMWLLRRGVGLWIATVVTLAAMNASSVHYLARPHLFSLLFFTAALWMLDEDRAKPTGCLWILVPLSAVWANLHAGFMAWLATLGFLVAVASVERNWNALRRYGLLAALSAAATLVNPYGWRLHQHIAEYLGSPWILENVQEFQSPSIRSESTLVFAVLLLAGVAMASRQLARGCWFSGGLVLILAFEALRSARHIPLFAVAAAPVLAAESATWWAAGAAGSGPRSALRLFWELGQDLARSRHISVWTAGFGAVALWLTLGPSRIAGFPERRFPVNLVSRHLQAMPARILTSDQWAGYLIFRLNSTRRVFFDGRSDFYGPAIGTDYRELLNAGPRWPQIIARYQFDAALLPAEWPLAQILERDVKWRLVDGDPVAKLLIRRSWLKTTPDPADQRCGGT